MLNSPVYLLPTLLTLGNLLCGFFATAATAGVVTLLGYTTEASAWLIVAAIALDGADGLVARRLGASSRMGVHLDNLADMVSFGVAPAMLIAVTLGLPEALGWIAASGYACCAALRLAHYAGEPSSPRFTGLPSPAAALVISGMALTAALKPMPFVLAFFMPAMMSGMMLSRQEWPHPRLLGTRGVLLVAASIAVGVCVLAYWKGLEGAAIRLVLVCSAVYIASPGMAMLGRRWTFRPQG